MEGRRKKLRFAGLGDWDLVHEQCIAWILILILYDTVGSAVGFQWCPHAGQGEKHSSSPTSIECKCAAVTSADTMKLSSFTPLLSCFVFFVSIYIYVMSCDRDLSKAKKDNPKIRGHDLGFTALDILVSLCVWIAKMKRLLTHCVTFRGFSSIHWR